MRNPPSLPLLHASLASEPEAAGWAPCVWPQARAGEALALLAHRLGWTPALAVPEPPAPGTALDTWLPWAAERLGVELEAADLAVPELGAWLPGAGPALLPWTDAQGAPGLLLLWPGGGRQVRLLGPDGRLHRVAAARLRDHLGRPFERPFEPEIEALLDEAALPARRRPAVRQALLRERLADTRLPPWWQLRLPPGAPMRLQARPMRLAQGLGGIAVLYALLYAGEISAWGLIGGALLGGEVGPARLSAWALLLFTLLALRLAGAHLQAGLARRAATWLKARLLVGALQLDVDRVRHEGVGHLLGRVIEASALESLAIGGGLSTVVASIELLAATVVLALGAAPAAHLALLAGWSVALALLCRWQGRALGTWTAGRLTLSHTLIEQMVGHRTRLAQERPARRDALDDEALHGHLARSRALDRSLTPLQVALPGLWLPAGLAVLLPGLLGASGAGSLAGTGLAISIGGLLLAQRAFGGITGGLMSLSRAAVAWRQVGELYAAARPDPARAPARHVPPPDPTRPGPTIEARGLRFRHAQGPEVLCGVDLRIEPGDRLLLQGGSGSGKSTLAAVLTGLRHPQAGQLLLRGQDAPTLGEARHAMATAAPQFHENHVFSGTLAFNLLMGRQWPPTPASLAEAQALCEDLGLGELLQRMPAGLQQRVGETGWQLSHGERSRLFLARALLQQAPLTVLDESFAALDPESLMQCLRTAQARARTLMVIAHP